MRIRSKLKKAVYRLGAPLGLFQPPVPLGDFAFGAQEQKAIKEANQSDIFRLFFEESGRPVHKWNHYLDIYQAYFGGYRGKPLSFLEIGVFDGGSLDFWRRYFGPDATIAGIDINPACAERVSEPNHVRIGSQADPDFLKRVVEEFGPFDIVLDDGSHIGWHQKASFDTLFPLLKDGGVYAIEDTHTSYWADHEGGFRERESAIETAKEIVDDMHAAYHRHARRDWAQSDVGAVHFYDSVIVIEKRRHERYGMIRGGGAG